jgi:hypothetical protein
MGDGKALGLCAQSVIQWFYSKTTDTCCYQASENSVLQKKLVK